LFECGVVLSELKYLLVMEEMVSLELIVVVIIAAVVAVVVEID